MLNIPIGGAVKSRVGLCFSNSIKTFELNLGTVINLHPEENIDRNTIASP